MNSRSPRVVVIARIPRLGAPPGESHSQTPMPTSSSTMHVKNAAVCQVHAIQLRSIARLPACAFAISAPASDAAEREPLRDVVAHEIDYERARHDRQRAGRRE